MLFQTVSNAHIIRQAGDQFSQLSYYEIRNLTDLILSALFDKQKLKMDINSPTIKLAHMYSQVAVGQSLLLFGSWDFVRLKVMRVPLKPDERLNTICHGQCHTCKTD